jgi:hypothetical protein
MSVPMDAANSVAIDFAAAEPKSGFGYAGQGSYYWSLEAAGRDSVRMKWQLEQEGGSSPIWQYRIPRSSGLAVFRRASSGLLLFRDKLKPWFEAQIQPASREPSYETNYVIEPVAADSLASPQKLKN